MYVGADRIGELTVTKVRRNCEERHGKGGFFCDDRSCNDKIEIQAPLEISFPRFPGLSSQAPLPERAAARAAEPHALFSSSETKVMAQDETLSHQLIGINFLNSEQ